MMKNISKAKRITIKAFISLIAVTAVFIAAFMIYANDYYRAEDVAVMAFADASRSEAEKEKELVFEAEKPDAGFIFYPGGKVEYIAYAPLLKALSEKGITCIVPEMPFNLAVFDIDAAKGIRERYGHIKRWYIGGHSLGGSMAAAFLEENAEDYEGLILLGSYSTTDLSDTGLKVLSVYGSEDQVLNREKYDISTANLPEGFSEFEIEGGCHAYFGCYGQQEGDGTPVISNEEQLAITAAKIAEFI